MGSGSSSKGITDVVHGKKTAILKAAISNLIFLSFEWLKGTSEMVLNSPTELW